MLRELAVESFTVVGHDLGVSVVQELLARRAEDSTWPSIDAAIFLNRGLFAEVYRSRPIQRILPSPAGHVIGPLLARSAIRRALTELFGPETKPTGAEVDSLLDVVRHNGGRSPGGPLRPAAAAHARPIGPPAARGHGPHGLHQWHGGPFEHGSRSPYPSGSANRSMR
ncbi:hypothetical protein [Nocardia sp. NPDC005825]|uniref:hypothetical protein n=1 Tax=unclassified Nocardia TaxID=2637762 RepID=UPI0033E68041